MLAKKESLHESFQRIYSESWKNCAKELEAIRELILILPDFNEAMKILRKEKKKILANSLVDISFCEAVRLSAHILFLASNALYKNAYDNIRYLIESIIQSTYLDMGHPNSNIFTKIEIWKEIEGKREYHARNLIGKLDLGKMKEQKATLEKEYSRLSNIIHFGHMQIMATLFDIQSKTCDGIPAKIDCDEVKRVLDSMKTALDILFLLIIVRFAEIEVNLKKNSAFIQKIKKPKFLFMCKIFHIKC